MASVTTRNSHRARDNRRDVPIEQGLTARAMVYDYTLQGHGLLYVARPQVDIRGCDRLISSMSANIVETAMAMGIRWNGAQRLLLRGSGSTSDYYAYLFEGLESFRLVLFCMVES
ncbi:Uncharacterized protein TCM_036184 [Theobroma cacao]|uniref:Uncharacterized protein n=1 Tax=Theobroma cacao TaxID=3641 RepID=A0A061FJC3_THECC|nr:Uncharacterized protein TCM_036184 [Theobroma cacao]